MFFDAPILALDAGFYEIHYIVDFKQNRLNYPMLSEEQFKQLAQPFLVC